MTAKNPLKTTVFTPKCQTITMHVIVFNILPYCLWKGHNELYPQVGDHEHLPGLERHGL